MISVSNIAEIPNSYNASFTMSSQNAPALSSSGSLNNNEEYNYMLPNNPIPYQESIGGTTYFYPSANGEASQQILMPTELIPPSASYPLDGNALNMAHPLPAAPYVVSDVNHDGRRHVVQHDRHRAPLEPFGHVPIGHVAIQGSAFFVGPELREHLLARNQETYSVTACLGYNGPIPVSVEHYHSLCPLEEANPDNLLLAAKLGYTDSSASFQSQAFPPGIMSSYTTSCFKAVDSRDGGVYCMHRIHGYYLTNIKIRKTLTNWRRFEHINAVKLKEVFSTKSFGDSSLIFVYPYHPGSITMMDQQFPRQHKPLHQQPSPNNSHHRDFPTGSPALGGRPSPLTVTLPGYNGHKGSSAFNGLFEGPHGRTRTSPANQGPVTESELWNFVIQISSAIRAIHSKGLYCGGLDTLRPSKILVDPFTKRLRLNCLGITDILTQDIAQNNFPNVASSIAHYQQEDLLAFGKLILALASNTLSSYQPQHFAICLRVVAQNYSPDLKNIILYLLSPGPGANSSPMDRSSTNGMVGVGAGHTKSINDIMPMIGARFYTHLESALSKFDTMEEELTKEMENSRLFRLLCKLGTINERPELSLDPSWSETGDRYLLKLFRDYLFHSAREDGTPWIDMSHLVNSLNKLDAGSHEKILLTSRDQMCVLVVSYADLKRCLETSFQELFGTPNLHKEHHEALPNPGMNHPYPYNQTNRAPSASSSKHHLH